jgi:hypothetical protein
MGRNHFVDAAVSRYARMNAAEKARHDLEQSMPYSQTFSRKQFPSAAAWARFLTLRCALNEQIEGTPLPAQHVEKRGANVLAAREAKEAAIAGVARCTAMGCNHEGTDVERQRVTYTNGVVTEEHLCPQCVRWLHIDPIYNVSTVEAFAVEG